jgi:SAM-dependent methyltransferase
MPSGEGAATFRAAAEVYDRHVGRYGIALAHELVRVAGVGPGQRALDVGCGPGLLTRVLADLLGGTHVAAVDPSEPFVEAARERVPGADVRLAAAEELPFPNAVFDVVLSQLVVNFMTDAEAGIREMNRVTRPDGVVASCVWDYAGGMTMLRAFWDAALELDPAAPDEGRTMRYCRPGELRALWELAGLRNVQTGELVAAAEYASFDDFWSPFPTGIAPSGAFCASLEPDRQAELAKACRRQLGSPDGPFRLSARAWYAVGRAPV